MLQKIELASDYVQEILTLVGKGWLIILSWLGIVVSIVLWLVIVVALIIFIIGLIEGIIKRFKKKKKKYGK